MNGSDETLTFPGVTQQMNFAERVMREGEPFRSLKGEMEAATARRVQQFERQERLTQMIQPTTYAGAATAHSTYLESLIKSQRALAQDAA